MSQHHSPYDWDVFVSYAHVNDTPPAPSEQQWVQIFVKNLENQLATHLGRREDVRVWMDHRLRGNDIVIPQILNDLERSATILIILSKAYRESTWCLDEMERFYQFLAQRSDLDKAVFVAEFARLDPPDERPHRLAQYQGYRFWEEGAPAGPSNTLGWPVPIPELDCDRLYYKLINGLAFDLARQIRRSWSGSVSKPETQPVVYPAEVTDDLDTEREGVRQYLTEPVVYLAEVTDDLDMEREGVRQYLTEEGFRVLPTVWYPRDPVAFQKAVTGDLGEAHLFVQLLSKTPGKKTPDLPDGYPGLQAQLAEACNKPMLQWYRRGLDLGEVTDPGHRRLLQGKTVVVEGIEEFKALVVQRVRMLAAPPPQDPVPSPGTDTLVFLNADEPDNSLSEFIRGELESRKYGYCTSRKSGTPKELRKDLVRNLLRCDGVILIYGKTPTSWVEAQLVKSRKTLLDRKRRLKAYGLYDGPPESKEPPNVTLPSIHLINCRAGFDPGEFQRFLDHFQDGRAS